MATEILDVFYAVAIEIAGPDAVARIQAAKGGCEVQVSNRTDGNPWLREVFGVDVAKKIIRRMRTVDADDRIVAGPRFYIPLGDAATMSKKLAEVDELLRQGLGVDDVARRTGITSRTVKRRRVRLRQKGECAPGASTARSEAPS